MIYINDMPKPFREGMTLEEAFTENNMKTKGPFAIYVNDDVIDEEDYKTFVIHDEDEIQQVYTFFAEAH